MKYPRQVYALTHNETKRTYIGSSEDVCRRYRQHIGALRKGHHAVEDMQADYEVHGENYTLTVLDRIESEEENSKEYEWMKKEGTYVRGKGYNYNDPYWKNFEKRYESELIGLIEGSKDPTAALFVSIILLVKFLGAEATLDGMKAR